MSKTLLQANSSTENLASDWVDGQGLKGSRLLTSNTKTWWVKDVWGPVESFFVRHRISPNTITMIGFALTCLAGLLIAGNHLVLGGWLIFIAGSFDFLDGRVARITGQQTRSGAFLDSAMDRYMDAAVLFGLAYFFRESWVFLLVLAVFLGSFTTSYIRAKAESMGISCSGGQMQRAERILYLGSGCVISGYWECLRYPFEAPGWSSAHWPLILILSFVALVSNKVAIDRFRSTFRHLKGLE